MIRISILRLKQRSNRYRGHDDAATNDKNLNSEIETTMVPVSDNSPLATYQ